MSPSIKLLGLAVAFALAGCNQANTPPADAAAAPAQAEAPPPLAEPVAPAADVATVAAPKLQATMRELWHGHIVHARDYAMAMQAGKAADATTAADAVVANAKQIAGAVGSFYGQPAGDQMMTLLGGHWGAVKAMTDARVKGDEAGVSKAMTDLNANAGAIAKFLSGANPNLPEDTVLGLLVAHGAHHAADVSLIVKGDTAGEAAEWTAMQTHMDMIADALAGAIAKQFQDKAS